jgi:hypothetical protein
LNRHGLPVISKSVGSVKFFFEFFPPLFSFSSVFWAHYPIHSEEWSYSFR